MDFEEFQDIILTLDKFKVDDNFVLDVHNNVEYNKIIIDYYKRMLEEGSDVLKNYGCNFNKSKISELQNCNKYWVVDNYDVNLVKDFVGTFLCKDKFCNNCKKVKQAVRMSRYIPELSKYKDHLYHITLTIPNVVGEQLRPTLLKMISSFRKFMRIIQGNYRCFINFNQYKYKGAIRSLEITYKQDIYHPHFHCAFVFENLDLLKDKINAYSYSNRSNDIRKFSDFEILIQKLWYMIYNNISLTRKNFDELECGYSCICDKFSDNDYMELFKYMTKSTSEDDELLSYDNFRILYFSIYNIKQIQGYGCLYQIQDNDITQKEIDEVYANIQSFLRSDERPRTLGIKPFDLLNDKNYLLISRKKIYQYLKEIK